MEDARICIAQIRSLSDQEASRECISMLTRILQRIASNPGVEKFRSIKLTNEKFQRYVWDVEPSKLLLIIAGFQTNEELNLISLPLGIDISPLISLLGVDQLPQPSNPPLTTLKLSGQGSGGGNVFTTPTLPGAAPPTAPATKTVPRGGLLVPLLEMGYSSLVASEALVQTNNVSVEKAIEWINMNPQVDLPTSTTATSPPNSASPPPTSTHIVSRYQDTSGERYSFIEKQRQDVLRAAMKEKKDAAKARENLMKNMQSDRNYQQAIRGATRLQSLDESSTNITPQPPCIDVVEKSNQVSIRVRLPNGSQTIIKTNSDATIEDLYQQVYTLPDLESKEIIISLPFSQTVLEDHTLTLSECSLGQGGNIHVQLSALRGQILAGEGKVYPTIVFTAATDHSIELDKAPPETLVVLMCTSSGSKASKDFENVFDSINADLGMNRQVIFMRVDIQAITMLSGLQGREKLPCFHFYKKTQLLFTLSTQEKQKLVDKILYLKDKDAESLEEERNNEASATGNRMLLNPPDSSSSDSDQDDQDDGSQVGINDPR